MESNDFGDLLLMHLNDDLFWEPQKTETEKPCGDTSTTTQED